MRLARDERLTESVAELWCGWRGMPTRTGAQNTRRSIMRVLIRRAERRGKAAPDGVEVTISRRAIAERAACSLDTVHRHITGMEEGMVNAPRR